MYAAMKSVLPNKSTMAKITNKLKTNYQSKIRKNEVEGGKLKQKTIDNKKGRGAKHPTTKLREFDGLIKQMKTENSDKLGEVGYFNETHITSRSGSQPNINDLARIHHYGSSKKNIPVRKI